MAGVEGVLPGGVTGVKISEGSKKDESNRIEGSDPVPEPSVNVEDKSW